MSTKTEIPMKSEIPTPIYAVAGAGEVAYEKLRELPAAASRTLHAAGQTTRAWRKRVAGGEMKLDRTALTEDLEKLRDAAQRRASAIVAGAGTVQERARTGYRHLVERGVRLIDGEPVETPSTPVPAVAAAPAAAPRTGTRAVTATTPASTTAAGPARPAARKGTPRTPR